MKVFISWSGEPSRSIATALRKLLPCMLQELEPFMSQHDIESGTRWAKELGSRLEESNYGILCLTHGNLTSPWLLFEAGAITKTAEGRACGLLFGGLTHAQLTNPLQQFQNRVFDQDALRALINDLNNGLTKPLEAEQLSNMFDKFWPDIETECRAAIQNATAKAAPQPRSSDDMLEEVVMAVRRIERSLETDGDNLAKTNWNHLYTTDLDERHRALDELGYVDEGVAGYVFADTGSSAVPLYCLHNSSQDDHFYTTSAAERDRAVDMHEYKSETTSCFVYPADSELGVPLYRLYSSDFADHFYTISEVERGEAMGRLDYEDEGVACRVLATSTDGAIPLYRLVRKNPRE